MSISYTKEDFSKFRDWIDLRLEDVTWQGRYLKDFEEFWVLFFEEGLTLTQITQRFNYAISKGTVGPLSAWFSWLKAKLICWTFIEKGGSLKDVSVMAEQSVGSTANTLRNFFVDHYPHLEAELSSEFQVSSVISPGLNLTYENLAHNYQFENLDKGSLDDEIMISLEVTLYEEWREFLRKFRKEIGVKGFDIKRIRRISNLKGKSKLILEVFALLLICVGMVWAVKRINIEYAQTLLGKISVYEPQFQWLDKTMVFKEETPSEEFTNFELKETDLEQVESAKVVEVFDEDERFDVESEVVLTSWDSLPRDFSVADLETSSYEELLRRGYRESQYGNTKVYRVMMRSVDTFKTRQRLDDLLEKYQVTQVDNVKPGLAVPGGMYYNLYVPREFLKEFLSQVTDADETTLYESQTRARSNPPGKNKVFIWVKKY